MNGNLFGVTDLVSCRGRIYFCLLPSHLLDITQYSNENSQIQMSVHSTGNLIPRMVAVTVIMMVLVLVVVGGSDSNNDGAGGDGDGDGGWW